MTANILEKSRQRVLARQSKSQREDEIAHERLQSDLEAAIKGNPGDVWRQVEKFFAVVRIPASSGRKRSVSYATESKYFQAVRALLQELLGMNIQVRSLDELTKKHLHLVIHSWEERQLSASSLATRYTCLKRFYGWLGKSQGLRSVRHMVQNPEAAKRSFSAVTPKSWNKLGVDIQDVLPFADERCIFFGAQLRLCHAFGLRVQEAVAMTPRRNHKGPYLEVTHGAKGGRGRHVAVETQYQLDVLEYVKGVAHKSTGLLRPTSITQKSAKERFYGHMRHLGLTRNGLGVTAHGLRHEYATSQYLALTGVEPPVNGGSDISADEVTKAAMLKLSNSLGHDRPEITTAYTGSVSHIAEYHLKNMQKLLTTLQDRRAPLGLFAQEEMARATYDSVEFCIHVVGPDADGKDTHGFPLNLAITLLKQGAAKPMPVDARLIQACSEAAQKTSGRPCIVQDASLIPSELSRLELIFSV